MLDREIRCNLKNMYLSLKKINKDITEIIIT